MSLAHRLDRIDDLPSRHLGVDCMNAVIDRQVRLPFGQVKVTYCADVVRKGRGSDLKHGRNAITQ